MNKTIISWTNVTWNPTHGCSKVSEGCRNCYAETLSLRYGHTLLPWTASNAEQNIRLQRHKLRDPYALKEPSRIFVNSMSDLFHPLVPDDYRAEIFGVMNDLPQHVFQILTKRPKLAAAWAGPWTPNIWMGASVEDQKNARRIDDIRSCGAAVKFISAEPLLGPIDCDLRGIDWLIVGGESGAGYRAMDQAWARSLRDQCLRDGVAYFFKQDSGPRTEMRPWLVEEDGSHWVWHQFPGQLDPPVLVTDQRPHSAAGPQRLSMDQAR